MHQGPVELGLGLAALGTAGETPIVASPSVALHSDLVSVAATVHLLSVDFQSVVPILSGEGRIRVWEDGPDGMGVALLLGAGIPPSPGWGVDTGVVVSTPRRGGFRGYAGTRFNTVFPQAESMTYESSGFVIAPGEYELPYETHLFGTAAAGVVWSSASGLTTSLELWGISLLATGQRAAFAPAWGLGLNASWALGSSGR